MPMANGRLRDPGQPAAQQFGRDPRQAAQQVSAHRAKAAADRGLQGEGGQAGQGDPVGMQRQGPDQRWYEKQRPCAHDRGAVGQAGFPARAQEGGERDHEKRRVKQLGREKPGPQQVLQTVEEPGHAVAGQRPQPGEQRVAEVEVG